MTKSGMAFRGACILISAALSYFLFYLLLYNFDGLQYTPKARNGLLQTTTLVYFFFFQIFFFIITKWTWQKREAGL